MSHGHDHTDYIRVFGDVATTTRGLTVLCDGLAPKGGTEVHQADRSLCISQARGSACTDCEHSRFILRFKPGVGNQQVACPRWDSIDDRLARKKPRYEIIRREVCLTVAPYEHCSSCPNKKVSEEPRSEPGWWVWGGRR